MSTDKQKRDRTLLPHANAGEPNRDGSYQPYVIPIRGMTTLPAGHALGAERLAV